MRQLSLEQGEINLLLTKSLFIMKTKSDIFYGIRQINEMIITKQIWIVFTIYPFPIDLALTGHPIGA